MANITDGISATVSCPGSETMTNILLPMFGNAWRAAGSLCNHTSSYAWVSAACQGKTACTLQPSITSLGGTDPVRLLGSLPGRTASRRTPAVRSALGCTACGRAPPPPA